MKLKTDFFDNWKLSEVIMKLQITFENDRKERHKTKKKKKKNRIQTLRKI
jgi:hypothetical protein